MVPLARTVVDVAAVLAAIAGRDSVDLPCSLEPVPDYAESLSASSVAGLRIGVVKETVSEDVTSPAPRAGVHGALQILVEKGVELVEVSLPLMRETRFVSQALTKPEAVSYHRRNLLERYEDFDFNTRVGFMEVAIQLPGWQVKLSAPRVVVARQVTEALMTVDVLVGAGSAGGAPPINVRQPVTTK